MNMNVCESEIRMAINRFIVLMFILSAMCAVILGFIALCQH